MRAKPKGRRWLLLALPSIVLVAALFFFEWLGSERPQSLVEVEVQPAVKPGSAGESAKN